jgi:hypothetical protein
MLLGRIDADRGDAGAGCNDFLVTVCQADQLAVAVRSPITAQKQQDNGRV